MSFSETVFLFILALVVFGPKKLPEIARQAGKLLAELRRASNEFKSQIETEITHLELQKKVDSLPKGPPKGAVASMSLNPASETVPHQTGATLAAPAEATLAGNGIAMTRLAEANVIAENSEIPPAAPSPALPETETETASATRNLHV
ncbi:MAG: twin-arginine translocase TatA/TatE family subunit [Candidatus Sulfotelmatobacter sp.]|jgi:sec-independent protein translocase protein TatB